MPPNGDIVRLTGLKKSFKSADRQELVVLDNLDFHMNSGEIVVLLGKSGSGKSTLLRIIAGLVDKTSGEALYRDKPISGPMDGVAMVFQSFALFPWLTVQENVELGLRSRGVGRAERRKRALAAIDQVGLDGFESAFPKELSGGMRQRVGFARALVVMPDLLLMDEPFSALDVLTAETLRGDLLELWQSRKIPTEGILIVSHNIQEAVLMADRILIFDSNPGRVKAEIPVNLPHPRYDYDPAVREIVDRIYTLMTGNLVPDIKGGIGLHYRLPPVAIGEITGLIDNLYDNPGSRANLAELEDLVHMPLDDLVPLIEACRVLKFVDQSDATILLTDSGRQFVDADILTQKRIFAAQLQANVPLVAHIRKVLEERPSNVAAFSRFQNELEDVLSEEDAESLLKTAIDWARYAELFAYDSETETLSLEQAHH